MLILGSCLALNLGYPGCCVFRWTPPCSNNECFCDVVCHKWIDCCSDIADIDCHPKSNRTLGKTNSGDHTINY